MMYKLASIFAASALLFSHAAFAHPLAAPDATTSSAPAAATTVAPVDASKPFWLRFVPQTGGPYTPQPLSLYQVQPHGGAPGAGSPDPTHRYLAFVDEYPESTFTIANYTLHSHLTDSTGKKQLWSVNNVYFGEFVAFIAGKGQNCLWELEAGNNRLHFKQVQSHEAQDYDWRLCPQSDGNLALSLGEAGTNTGNCQAVYIIGMTPTS